MYPLSSMADAFTCSISLDIMGDPVIVDCAEKHTFDRPGIEDHFTRSSLCPLCHVDVISKGLTPNRLLRETIQLWKRAQEQSAPPPPQLIGVSTPKDVPSAPPPFNPTWKEPKKPQRQVHHTPAAPLLKIQFGRNTITVVKIVDEPLALPPEYLTRLADKVRTHVLPMFQEIEPFAVSGSFSLSFFEENERVKVSVATLQGLKHFRITPKQVLDILITTKKSAPRSEDLPRIIADLLQVPLPIKDPSPPRREVGDWDSWDHPSDPLAHFEPPPKIQHRPPMLPQHPVYSITLPPNVNVYNIFIPPPYGYYQPQDETSRQLAAIERSVADLSRRVSSLTVERKQQRNSESS